MWSGTGACSGPRCSCRERIAAAGALDPPQLLRGQFERLLPGRLTERRIPVVGSRDAVPDVHVQPLEQRQLAHALAGGARRRTRLRAPSLGFDRPPRPRAPLGAGRALPDPAAALFGPAFSDQGPGESVPVLGEVVAEAPFHTGGALIRRVQLDVGRGDADDLVGRDVQIHLASHAAVRTDGPHDFLRVPDLFGREALARHHLEDRSRRADADAFAAPGAARLVGVAVRTDDDLGVLAAVPDVQHAHDLDVLARAHAAGAQDAGGHIVTDHRDAGALVARAQREVARLDGRRHDVVLHEVALGEQAEDPFAVFDRGVRLGRHDHAFGNFGRARRYQFRLTFHGDEADAAVPDNRESGIPAERRDLHGGRSGGIEDGLALFRNY